ncbi:MAG: hypothetical protein OEY63_02125 [Gemmatimonadota bacterium]|nr:hypothetical protein [Gemmatimonadota bacterium]
MALDDVFSLRIKYDNAGRPAVSYIWFQEVVPFSGTGSPTASLAASFSAVVSPLIIETINAACRLVGIEVRKHGGTAFPPARDDYPVQYGPLIAEVEPIPQAILQLYQLKTNRRRNGLIYFPGTPLIRTQDGKIKPADLAADYEPLRLALLATRIAPAPNVGQWELGVMSRKIVDENAGNPNRWKMGFSGVASATWRPTLSFQKRRGMRIDGLKPQLPL